jgi:PAS domain S-box-containing protein
MSNNPEIARLPLAVDELQKHVTELEAALREQEKIIADYRQNEDTYRSLFKNMLNGLVHCRMVFKNGEPDDFIFLTVNEVFESLTGLKDVIGKKVTELFPTIKETDPKMFEILGLVSLSGQPERFEIFLEAAKEWLSVSVYSPKEEHFVAVFDVISKKKKTEQALRDSLDHASRLSNLLELSSQPFVQDFPDGSFGLFNKAFIDLTGYTREELARITMKELTPPEWVSLEQEKLEKLQATGEAVRYQKEYIRKDGSRVPVEIFLHLIREKDGKPKYYYGFITDITERRRTQKALHVAYTKYKMLFHAFPLGITIADSSGQILESNRMAEKTLGLSSKEHKYRHIDSKEWQVVRLDGSPMPPEEYASVRALKEGRLIKDVELGIMKPSGGITWLSVAATPIPLDEGGVIVTYLDITERKRIQDDLRWSEERLHLALNAANAGTWEWDLRTNESSWSEELWELYRMRPHSDAPSFDIWLETVHPDDRAKAEESLKDAVRRGTKLSVEWRVLDPVGKDRWLMLRGKPAYDIAGRIGRFIGISIDITDRKKAELALKESEQKFKIVADHTYDFESWLDPNGNYLYASPSCERIYGYNSSEFISDPSLLRRVVHPEDLARFDEHLLTVETAHTHGEVLFRIVRKDGGIRWIEHACQPVFDEQGHYLGVRSSNRDVTERKQVDAALKESDEMLRLALTAAQAGAWSGICKQMKIPGLRNCGRCMDLNRIAASLHTSHGGTSFIPMTSPARQKKCWRLREREVSSMWNGGL